MEIIKKYIMNSNLEKENELLNMAISGYKRCILLMTETLNVYEKAVGDKLTINQKEIIADKLNDIDLHLKTISTIYDEIEKNEWTLKI